MNKIIFLSAVLWFITLPLMTFAGSKGSNNKTGLYFFNKHSLKANEFSDSICVLKPEIFSKVSSIQDKSDINKIEHNKAISDSLNTLPTLKWYDMFANIPRDVVRFYDQEFTISRIPLYIGIAGLTAGLIATDDKTWKASNKFYWRNNFNKNVSDAFVEVGDGKSQFVLAAAFAAYGFIAQDERSLRTGSEVVEAVLTSGAVVQVLKHITGRQSPYLSTRPGGAWRFFPNQIQYHKHVPAYDAYPSGHLTTSLSAFVVIAENYPEAKWIMPVSCTAEALLAVSMVNQGIHWYSDYPLAILLGYTFGKIAAHPFGQKNDNSKISDLQILPYISHLYNGVQVAINF